MENKQTFLGRVQVLDPLNINRIKLAYTMAKFYHRGQTRKGGERYFEHCRRSALVLMDELKIYDPDLICSILLHDTAEDSELDIMMIDQFFGTSVAMIVRRVTKPTPWVAETKQSYYDRFIHGQDTDAMIVKACDRLDNLRDMRNCSTDFIGKQVAETRQYYVPMLHELIVACPQEHLVAALYLDKTIRERLDYLQNRLDCEVA
jgi:guanosine-3',5'-bis(diphosphate) 3'-pyrophosphohydrolase